MSRAIGDLTALIELLGLAANLEWLAGRLADVGVYLREAAGIASRIGDYTSLRHCVDQCALVCAATGRPAEAITLWAAVAADLHRAGLPPAQADDRLLRRQAAAALRPQQAREATERGALMTLAAAVEFVIMLTAPREPEAAAGGAGELTGRERELVILVAQGRTNAEIAAELFISIRTVSSHLDRIRDKTGYRRRADLTRLALREGLV
jgi:DNA-binding CsgD family transcriptional regulator